MHLGPRSFIGTEILVGPAVDESAGNDVGPKMGRTAIIIVVKSIKRHIA